MTLMAYRGGLGCGNNFLMRTRRTCCCSMICSASPTRMCSFQIDSDARRRRLTAFINTASLARTEPVLFIIEDAHWVDAVSESMLTEFLADLRRPRRWC